MLSKRSLVILSSVFLFGFAPVGTTRSSDADQRLSDALQQALPTLVSSGDYLAASRLYYQLAAARSRLNETATACAALSQSLATYRRALADDSGALREGAAPRRSDDAGMQEIRSKFGCTPAQFG
jgi:hypothetical protein